ncbi:hypothetical protein LY474_30965 [Myxococcus stipitatus]|uniref:hypothetical protein n=1 Tax=Myxococcus stipitatus TaxID=83455 RepID=UPI001F43E6CD|nr:hypothetical protein [Myxococcus stipitatus]MCE9672236.1 hypothetical protein [Myxococcus stipitatus]
MAHRHGVGRVSAAVLGAPAAAVLASLAAAAVLPVAEDVRWLVAVLGVLPAVATGSCLALLARSAPRAWVGSVLVAVVSAGVLVST